MSCEDNFDPWMRDKNIFDFHTFKIMLMPTLDRTNWLKWRSDTT